MTQSKPDLTSDAIPDLIKRIAVPASVGFFFNTMYNVVDTYFAGQLSTSALAAMSLSFPVFFILLALGYGLSTGTTALIGQSLGEKNPARARLYAKQGMVTTVLVALILMASSPVFVPVLFRLLGASDQYLQICNSYMLTIYGGALFFCLNFSAEAILNAEGSTRYFRNFLIVGFILNLILDPWFVYGGLGLPAMGIRGVAIATVLIQLLGNGYLLFQAIKTGIFNGGTLREWVPNVSVIARIGGQAIPASLNLLTVAVGIFVINWYASRFGKFAVAAYGVGVRIEQIALLPSIGLNIATLSLVAQNMGAGRPDRVAETVRVALRYGIRLMLVGAVPLLLFAAPITRLFTSDPQVIQAAAMYIRVDSLTFCAYILLFVSVSALQGLKQPIPPLIIGVLRQFVFPVIVIYLLAIKLNLGINGVWYGVFLVTWTAGLGAFWYAQRQIKKIQSVVY